ncbi:hypothetical protein [Niastella sp. OAS944]|uniref:hypothetical protein n=1 Tax=Niastella sp. OAS944 TaxID=2664089 RepID=UPI00346A0F5D|nr:putative membrane protein YesL [Chitinophagaceae bacterium OAS944]
MYKKLNDLQFVIGLFFSVVSVILLLNVMLGTNVATKLNTLTGSGFLVFGLLMMFIRSRK